MASITPSPREVLFGKGQITSSHPGNRTFRSIVDKQKEDFVATSVRKEKRRIASGIVCEIHRLGGRFLMELGDATTNDDNDARSNNSGDNAVHPKILSKTWKLVDEDRVLDKVLHRLRERNTRRRRPTSSQLSLARRK